MELYSRSMNPSPECESYQFSFVPDAAPMSSLTIQLPDSLHGKLRELADAQGKRWIIHGWKPIHRAWGNAPCPCLHADPKIPDCAPGATQEVQGVLAFYEGDDVKAELKRLAKEWPEVKKAE